MVYLLAGTTLCEPGMNNKAIFQRESWRPTKHSPAVQQHKSYNQKKSIIAQVAARVGRDKHATDDR